MTRKPEVAVTADYLLRGTVFALEQCGLLLRDARILCEAGSYASAVALTAFAREELGRYKILRELWKRTAAGESFSVKQINKKCEQHVEKQKRQCSASFNEPTITRSAKTSQS
jgi:AbiV family abortive infection protein